MKNKECSRKKKKDKKKKEYFFPTEFWMIYEISVFSGKSKNWWKETSQKSRQDNQKDGNVNERYTKKTSWKKRDRFGRKDIFAM